MRLQSSKIERNSGVVLVIVLIIIIIMSIIGASIFSISMSQSRSSRSQVDQIVAEQLAKGAFWSAYNQNINANNPNFTSAPLCASPCVSSGGGCSCNLNGRTFSYQVSPSVSPYNASVEINY